jgi:hypothetical protein
MRSRAVAVITVSLLVIAAATAYQLRAGILHLAGADRPAPGMAPFQLGKAWPCPGAWPVKAYQPQGLYYPPNHPAVPVPVVKPARCFRAESDARTAGFRLAPPPKGGVVFEGVYLVPASSRVRDECRSAAERIGFAIPCPSLLPATAADDPCSIRTGCLPDGGQALEVFGFTIFLATPADFLGPRARGASFASAGQLVLTVVGVPLATAIGRELNLCTRGRLGPTVMGTLALWSDCSVEGSPGSTLTWLSGGAIFAVTTRERGPAAERLVEFFASKLVLVAG